MSAPAGYTEKTLADYMHAELGKAAVVLGYAVGAADAGSYQEAVNSALLTYGVEWIGLALDIPKLRALARVEAWRRAVSDLAVYYKFTADDAAYERNQMYVQAQANLVRALLQALAWDPDYRVTTTRAQPVNDPYRWLPDERVTP